MPEGIQLSPPPVMYEPRPPAERTTSIGSGSFFAMIGSILGVVIAVGVIVGAVGKAFYVTRDEYNQQVVKTSEAKVLVDETLKRIDQSLTRQEAALGKLADSIEELKQAMAARRR